MSNHPTILCFGEMLWDFLPDGLFPGGAPFNVGYHLHNLDNDVRLVSALGRDRLGDEILRRLNHWGLSAETIVRHQGLPTGSVIATLGGDGDASYEITTSVAWDQILITEDSVRAAVAADALVFGSLAQRSQFNRTALERLLAVLPTTAWRVFDVNLRAPHDDLDLVRELAKSATLIKLNDEEAARIVLGAKSAQPGSPEPLARSLNHNCGCPMVCITAGSRGAGLLIDDQWHWEDGQTVEVADTIGSGDAFLARLVSALLRGEKPPAAALAAACRHGEWVAAQRGATPAY